jgi:pyruvate formate lyase activating enzyme
MVRLLVEEGLIDYIAMDIKAPWERYEEVVKASVDLRSVKLTFRFILSSGIEHEMRTTVVPGIHSKRDVIRIAKQIKGARVYFLQGFRPMNTLDPKFMKLKPLSEFELREMARECNKYIPTKLRL